MGSGHLLTSMFCWALMVNVHDGLDTFRRAGVRQIWVYRALDDGREVMILQEVDNEVSARRWIDHPGCTAQWMSGVGFGPYPPVSSAGSPTS
jgi:hypothetical protein